jgi:hypothetical protein
LDHSLSVGFDFEFLIKWTAPNAEPMKRFWFTRTRMAAGSDRRRQSVCAHLLNSEDYCITWTGFPLQVVAVLDQLLGCGQPLSDG